MELWEIEARESIRDLVARYNANGDTGRFAVLLELFAADAVMELDGRDGRVEHRGRKEIEQIFTGTRDRWAEPGAQARTAGHVRHHVATHQIDLVDEHHAKGRSYFQVLMAHGLDHWGRYIDEYVRIDGRWLFASRRVLMDGWAEDSLSKPA